MSKLLFIGGLGIQELFFIIIIILLFFGGKKIPELMKGIGKGIRSFKEGLHEIESDIKDTSASESTSEHQKNNSK